MKRFTCNGKLFPNNDIDKRFVDKADGPRMIPVEDNELFLEH